MISFPGTAFSLTDGIVWLIQIIKGSGYFIESRRLVFRKIL